MNLNLEQFQLTHNTNIPVQAHGQGRLCFYSTAQPLMLFKMSSQLLSFFLCLSAFSFFLILSSDWWIEVQLFLAVFECWCLLWVELFQAFCLTQCLSWLSYTIIYYNRHLKHGQYCSSASSFFSHAFKLMASSDTAVKLPLLAIHFTSLHHSAQQRFAALSSSDHCIFCSEVQLSLSVWH